jgi:hypothetical protein
MSSTGWQSLPTAVGLGGRENAPQERLEQGIVAVQG